LGKKANEFAPDVTGTILAQLVIADDFGNTHGSSVSQLVKKNVLTGWSR
jgi:hypothetical protein